MSNENCLVKAIYSFKGKNNDELCFKKGDIITVTQKEEGGWWEGTLGETTGWFPSNYVTEYKGKRPKYEIMHFTPFVFNFCTIFYDGMTNKLLIYLLSLLFKGYTG